MSTRSYQSFSGLHEHSLQHETFKSGSVSLQIPSKVKIIEMKLLSHEENFKTMNKVISAIQSFIDSQEETNNNNSKNASETSKRLQLLSESIEEVKTRELRVQKFEGLFGQMDDQIVRVERDIQRIMGEMEKMGLDLENTENRVRKFENQFEKAERHSGFLEREVAETLEQMKRREEAMAKEKNRLKSLEEEVTIQLESTLMKTTNNCQFLQSQTEQMAESIRRLQERLDDLSVKPGDLLVNGNGRKSSKSDKFNEVHDGESIMKTLREEMNTKITVNNL